MPFHRHLTALIELLWFTSSESMAPDFLPVVPLSEVIGKELGESRVNTAVAALSSMKPTKPKSPIFKWQLSGSTKMFSGLISRCMKPLNKTVDRVYFINFTSVKLIK